MVSCIFYFLSVLSVAKYKKILDSVKQRTLDTLGSSPTVSITGASGASPTGALEMPCVLGLRSESREDSVESSLESAGDVRDGTAENTATLFGTEGLLHSPALLPPHSTDVSEQIGTSLQLVGSFLCKLLTENRGVLTKVLVGADGRQLLTEG